MNKKLNDCELKSACIPVLEGFISFQMHLFFMQEGGKYEE
jgi:hypothetical protein